MLSNAPVVFNEENVKFKEFSELTSLAQMMFSNFLYDSHSQEGNRFPWCETPDELLLLLGSKFKNENLWVVYYKDEPIGFWCLLDESDGLTLYSYLPPEHQNGDFDLFYINFFYSLSTKTKTNIVLNLNHFTPQQRLLYANDTQLLIVNINLLKSDSSEKNFSDLLQYIKPYYL